MSYVYFLHAPSVNLMKIGTSIQPNRRVDEVKYISPVPLFLLAVIDGGFDVEAAMHGRFAHLHSHGEWFHAVPELIFFAQISELKSAWNAAGTDARQRFREFIDTPVMDETPFGDDLEIPASLRRTG